jgi:phage baseplate assembly protein W
MTTDLQAIYLDSDNKIKFGFGASGKTFRKLSRAGLLLQRIVLRMFTSVGSNKLNPDFGSQFLNSVGSTVSKGGEGVYRALIVASILQIENAIKLEQAELQYAHPQELLKNIEIEAISSSSTDIGTWNISLIIHTNSDESFRLNL